jgi:UV DNA damage endonuclease
MKNNLGYCCINVGLSEKGITTNKGMVQKTFLERGLKYVDEISMINVNNLVKILEWNKENKIHLFRMSSDIFPWCSEYEFTDLPSYAKISDVLKKAGDLAKESNQRLTFHPSHYTILASCNDNVVKKSIKELRQHAEIMDMMGLERSTYYPINIHIGTSKPTKSDAAERFCRHFENLPENVKSRLVVENDDKLAGFTPNDLYTLVYEKIGTPITFDYHHYMCNPDHGLSEEDALDLCLSTWKTKAITHYSDSRKIYEDSTSKDVAHSDWIWNPEIPSYGREFDIELEVKMKEKALLQYRDRLYESQRKAVYAQSV